MKSLLSTAVYSKAQQMLEESARRRAMRSFESDDVQQTPSIEDKEQLLSSSQWTYYPTPPQLPPQLQSNEGSISHAATGTTPNTNNTSHVEQQNQSLRVIMSPVQESTIIPTSTNTTNNNTTATESENTSNIKVPSTTTTSPTTTSKATQVLIPIEDDNGGKQQNSQAVTRRQQQRRVVTNSNKNSTSGPTTPRGRSQSPSSMQKKPAVPVFPRKQILQPVEEVKEDVTKVVTPRRRQQHNHSHSPSLRPVQHPREWSVPKKAEVLDPPKVSLLVDYVVAPGGTPKKTIRKAPVPDAARGVVVRPYIGEVQNTKPQAEQQQQQHYQATTGNTTHTTHTKYVYPYHMYPDAASGAPPPPLPYPNFIQQQQQRPKSKSPTSANKNKKPAVAPPVTTSSGETSAAAVNMKPAAAAGRDPSPKGQGANNKKGRKDYTVDQFAYTKRMLAQHKRTHAAVSKADLSEETPTTPTQLQQKPNSSGKLSSPQKNSPASKKAAASPEKKQLDTTDAATTFYLGLQQQTAPAASLTSEIHSHFMHLFVVDSRRQGTDMRQWARTIHLLSEIPGGMTQLLEHHIHKFSLDFQCALLTLLCNCPSLFSQVVLPHLLPNSERDSLQESAVVSLLGFHDILPAPLELGRLILRAAECIPKESHDTLCQTCMLAVRCLGGVPLLKVTGQTHTHPWVRRHALAALAHPRIPRHVTSCVCISIAPTVSTHPVSYKIEVDPQQEHIVRSYVVIQKDFCVNAALRALSPFPELSAHDLESSINRIASCVNVQSTCGVFVPKGQPSSPPSRNPNLEYSLDTLKGVSAYYLDCLVRETHEDVLAQVDVALAGYPFSVMESALQRVITDYPRPPHHHFVFVLAQSVTKLVNISSSHSNTTLDFRAKALAYITRCVSDEMATKEVRNAAVMGLRAFGADAFEVASQHVLNAMYQGVTSTQIALGTLATMGSKAVGLVIEVAVFEGLDDSIRVAAVRSMQQILSLGDGTARKSIVMALKRLLHDVSPAVRAEAAAAIAVTCQVGEGGSDKEDSSWLWALNQLLADTEAEVREAAATGMALYGGVMGTELLTECAIKGYTNIMQQSAISGLRFGGESGFLSLLKLLGVGPYDQVTEGYIHDTLDSIVLQGDAVESDWGWLSSTGRKDALEAIHSLLQKDHISVETRHLLEAVQCTLDTTLEL